MSLFLIQKKQRLETLNNLLQALQTWRRVLPSTAILFLLLKITRLLDIKVEFVLLGEPALHMLLLLRILIPNLNNAALEKKDVFVFARIQEILLRSAEKMTR